MTTARGAVRYCRYPGCEEPVHLYFYQGRFKSYGKRCAIHNGYHLRAGSLNPAWRGGHRAAILRTTYKIEPEEWEALAAKQQGRCAICQAQPARVESLHVDHDHITGRVRGLLCGTCNRGLGQLKDSVFLLQSAIIYLREAT